MNRRLRIAILARDGYRCVYCGRTAADARLEVDHIVPRKLQGDDDPSNLLTACHDCNSGKSATLTRFRLSENRGEFFAGKCHVAGCRRPPEALLFWPSLAAPRSFTRCCHDHYTPGEYVSTLWLGYSL